MVKIIHKVTIEAGKDKVMHALTTLEGLKGWWAEQTAGSPAEVDGEIEFGDKQYFYNKMKVLELGDNRVLWEVLESTGGNPKDSEIWNNTKISFDLEEKKLERLGGKTATILMFTHDGFPSLEEKDESYEKFFADCNWHWGFFLYGLKELVEKGKGMPM